MTEINFKGKTYQVNRLKYGKVRQLEKLRKEAIDSKNPILIDEALLRWLQETTNITIQDIEDFYPEELLEFANKVGEATQIPLEPNKSLPEQSSPTV